MHGFPIKGFENDDYCSDDLLGLVLFVIQMHFVRNALDIFVFILF